MNQEKTGKFIADCRKQKKMTQSELGERLGVTEKSISNWENGLNLPDSSLMLELSNIFGISVNELLSGEIIENEDYMNKAEEKLLELKKINEKYAKQLLYLECIIGFGCSITFITLIFIASFIKMDTIIRILLIIFGFVLFIIGVMNCIKIEQTSGFYECGKCHHRYIPTYGQVLFSVHNGRTRKMKCPKCGRMSWNKKVISK